MGSGVLFAVGVGSAWLTPTFLLRTYGLNVAQAGAITGHIHLVGGMLATTVAVWLMSRPFMLDPRRVLWMLGVGHRLRYRSLDHRLLDALARAGQVDVLGVHPRHLFLHWSLHGTGAESGAGHMRSTFTAWSVLVGNVFNLIVAPQVVGILSDWFGGAHGSDAASLRLALLVLAPTGFWAPGISFWRPGPLFPTCSAPSATARLNTARRRWNRRKHL